MKLSLNNIFIPVSNIYPTEMLESIILIKISV